MICNVVINLLNETVQLITSWYYILIVIFWYMLVRKKITNFLNFIKDALTSIIVGMACSFLGIITGVYLNLSTDLLYLIPVTIIMSFINKRYVCLSYTSSVLMIGTLINPNIKIDFIGLMGLVAIFHLIEGILILTIKEKETREDVIYYKGKLTKGTFIEKTWIAPFSILLINRTMLLHTESFINTKILKYLTNKIVFSLLIFSVVLIVRFGTIAIKSTPKKKIVTSGTELIIYSLTILFIYITARKIPYMTYIGIITMPLMHELFILKNIVDEHP